MHTEIKGYWSEKKEKLKQKYPNITEEDLHYNDGKEMVMIEIIAYKLGKTVDEFRNDLAAL